MFFFFWSIVCIDFACFNKSLKHFTSESTMFIVLDLFIKIMMSHVVMYLKIGKVGCLWCIILYYIGRTWSFWINKAYYETLIICGLRLLQGYKIIQKQAILFCQYSTLSLLWIGLYIISWFPCLKSSRAYVTQEILKFVSKMWLSFLLQFHKYLFIILRCWSCLNIFPFVAFRWSC